MSRGKVVDFHLMYDVPDADWQILKERIMNKPDDFWKKASMNQKSAGGVYDRHGHCAELRVRVHPIILDLIAKMREEMPEWYKSQSEAARALFTIGLHFATALLPDGKKTTNFEKMEKRLENLSGFFTLLHQMEMLRKKKQEIFNSEVFTERKKKKLISKIDILVKELGDEINSDDEKIEDTENIEY